MNIARRFASLMLIAGLSSAAQAEVRFAAELERGRGAGYNATHHDKRVKTPGSVRQRGDIARHTRMRSQYKQTLKHAARNPRPARSVRFDLAQRRPGAGYNNTRYDRRIAQPQSILKNSSGHRAVRAERRFAKNLGSRVRGDMTHRGQVARHARYNTKYKTTLQNTRQIAKRSTHARTAGKILGRGLLATGARYTAREALGVNVPDAYDGAKWTYDTLKNPGQAPKRVVNLGHNAAKEVRRGVNTVTNPTQLVKGLSRTASKASKAIGGLGCQAGMLFGRMC